MNDDATEKAKRRKSAHFAAHPDDDENARPRQNGAKRAMGGLALQQQGINQKRGKRLSAVEPSAPIVSMEVMNNNFEEWMKLATDNKITANNTWNFALIDYFADLTLLRNGPDDQSINFQKASCTLDGCVKIWTSRVDSVATETGKLLSGLAGGADDDANEDEDEDAEEGAEPKATRKTHRSEATLAKSFATLQIKKFDLEFTVDPLFKKTSADFDEGGAMGLLMNHLGVDGKGRIVFDAGDAGGEENDEDEPEEMEEEIVDLAKLREFMPDLDALDDMEISETLSSFKFTSDANSSAPDFTTLLGLKDSWQDPEPEHNHALGYDGDDGFDMPMAPMDDYAPEGEVDFFADEGFGGAQPMGFDDDDAVSTAGDDNNQSHQRPGMVHQNSLALVGPGGHFDPFDPRRQSGGEMVVALGGEGDGETEGMFDYFDKGFGKNWAGAGHWKLRKVSRKDPAATAAQSATKKSTKAPFVIDFTSPSTVSTKELFTSGTKTSLTLPKSKSKVKKREEWLLPDDMHFSSHQLLRLFLKPKFSLKMRRHRLGEPVEIPMGENGEVDENFWARAAAERMEVDGDGSADFDAAPAPFESQFFQDDDDYGPDEPYVHMDDNDPLPPLEAEGEAQDLWAATQGQEIKRARPENVNFAKKAKRVDVKRLKDDIWSGLRTLVPPSHPREEASESEPDLEVPQTPTETDPVKTFDTVITSLRETYPNPKMSEISTSFCFICLLHLANEEGLKIETARTDGKEGVDSGFRGYATAEHMASIGFGGPESESGEALEMGEKRDRVIGELEALRVYKDHTAGRAA